MLQPLTPKLPLPSHSTRNAQLELQIITVKSQVKSTQVKKKKKGSGGMGTKVNRRETCWTLTITNLIQWGMEMSLLIVVVAVVLQYNYVVIMMFNINPGHFWRIVVNPMEENHKSTHCLQQLQQWIIQKLLVHFFPRIVYSPPHPTHHSPQSTSMMNVHRFSSHLAVLHEIIHQKIN